MTYLANWLLACAAAILAMPCAIADAETRDASCLRPKIDWRNYEWVLVTGQGKTACEEMLRYLKARPKDAPLPVCPEERLPKNGNWTRPDWMLLDDNQRQALLRDIPTEFANTYQAEHLRETSVWKMARVDITADGIPETLLAHGHGSANCHRVTRCASSEGDHKGYVIIPHWGAVDWYDMAAMDETGTRIDWSRSEFHGGGIVYGIGEIVFYKKRPYQLSSISWSQKSHDNYLRHIGPENPYSRTFELAPLSYLKKDHEDSRTPAVFNNVVVILPDETATCHFGYYHRENLKRTGPLKRR